MRGVKASNGMPRKGDGGNQQQRDDEGEHESRVGSEGVSRGEGIRNRPGVVERHELTVNRKHNISGSVEPAQTRRTRSAKEEVGRRTPK